MKKNTNLCVDLKTIMQEDTLLHQGRTYRGVLTRDAEHHYLFEEEAHASGRTHRLTRNSMWGATSRSCAGKTAATSCTAVRSRPTPSENATS